MKIRDTLDKLAIKHKTDKGSTCHNYTSVYDNLFTDYELVKSVLEIGVLKGKSLRMWKEAFPNAQIYGIDNNPKYIFEEERIKCFLADQSKREDLIRVARQIGGNIDFIIDDGSHHVHDQVLSVKTLVPFLSENGIYIIEDVLKLGEVMDELQGINLRVVSTNPDDANNNLIIIRMRNGYVRLHN